MRNPRSIDVSGENVVWRPATRIAFRFAFCYIALFATYMLDQTAAIFDDRIASAGNAVNPSVWWFGSTILHVLSDTSSFRGGDTTFGWVLVAFFVVVAAAVASIWSLLDRKRTGYPRLYAWLRLGIAVYLACELLMYGLDKVIPTQFGQMTLVRMAMPIGSLTPMGLLWAFMSASPGYTIFAGVLECGAAILLLIPKFRTLGALVAAAVLANVFALNIFYDVTVKIFSFHLLALALFLTLPDLPRLANVLVLNRPAAKSELPDPSSVPAVNRAAVAATWLFAAVWSSLVFHAVMTGYLKRIAPEDAGAPFYNGIWSVDDFRIITRRGPVPDPGVRWERLVFETGAVVDVYVDGVMVRRTYWIDKSNRRMAMAEEQGVPWTSRFSFRTLADGRVALNGLVDGVPFQATVRRLDPSTFPLVRYGGIHPVINDVR